MSNILFAFWIGLSAAMLLLFVYAAVVNLRNRRARPIALDELLPSFLAVDVEAFTELIDANQEHSGSLEQGRQAQSRRTQLTIDCLRRMAHNAALLQRLGYGYLHSSNPLISELAQEMIDAGVHVRLYTFMGLIVLHLSRILRLTSLEILSTARIAELREMMSENLIPSYQQLKDKAGNLACLKFSGLHEALSQTL